MGKYGFRDYKSRRTEKLHDQFKSYNNLPPFFFYSKFLNVGMRGVYPEAMDLNIALHTQISFGVSVYQEKALSEPKNLHKGHMRWICSGSIVEQNSVPNVFTQKLVCKPVSLWSKLNKH